jgi:hypothetical protein
MGVAPLAAKGVFSIEQFTDFSYFKRSRKESSGILPCMAVAKGV